jgi:hypothetical protein
VDEALALLNAPLAGPRRGFVERMLGKFAQK